jgi:hypothetical protein
MFPIETIPCNPQSLLVKEKNRTALMIEALTTPVDVGEIKKPLKEVLALVRTKYKINIVCSPSLTKKMSSFGIMRHAASLRGGSTWEWV